MTPIEQLKHAIGVLAASPEDQLLYLIRIGHVDDSQAIDQLTNIDELGLQFEDAIYLVTQLLCADELTAKAGYRINELNNFLLSISGIKDPDFWTIQALFDDNRWTHIRILAQDCLSEMAT